MGDTNVLPKVSLGDRWAVCIRTIALLFVTVGEDIGEDTGMSFQPSRHQSVCAVCGATGTIRMSNLNIVTNFSNPMIFPTPLSLGGPEPATSPSVTPNLFYALPLTSLLRLPLPL